MNIGEQKRLTNAAGFLKYPIAIDGPVTTSSPRSPSVARLPSGFITLATMPGIHAPALPTVLILTPGFREQMVVEVSVRPAGYISTTIRTYFLGQLAIALPDGCIRE